MRRRRQSNDLTQSVPVTSLPDEIWSSIIRRLQLNELLALRATCHSMFELVAKEAIQFELLKWGRQLVRRGKNPNHHSLWYIVRYGNSALLCWAQEHWPYILTSASVKSKAAIITYVCERECRKLAELMQLGCISEHELHQIYYPYELPTGYSRLLCTEDTEQLEWVLQRIGFPRDDMRYAAVCALHQAIQLKMSVSVLKRLIQRLSIQFEEILNHEFQCCLMHCGDNTSHKYGDVFRAAIYNDNTAALLFFCEHYGIWKEGDSVYGVIGVLYLVLYQNKSSMLIECLTQALLLMDTDNKTVLYERLTYAALDAVVDTGKTHILAVYAEGLIHLHNQLQQPPPDTAGILAVGICSYIVTRGYIDIIGFWRQLLRHEIIAQPAIMEAVHAQQLELRNSLFHSMLLEHTKQLLDADLGLKERMKRKIKLCGLRIVRSCVNFRFIVFCILPWPLALAAYVIWRIWVVCAPLGDLCFGPLAESAAIFAAILLLLALSI